MIHDCQNLFADDFTFDSTGTISLAGPDIYQRIEFDPLVSWHVEISSFGNPRRKNTHNFLQKHDRRGIDWRKGKARCGDQWGGGFLDEQLAGQKKDAVHMGRLPELVR